MIVNCPNCNIKFSVNDALIPQSGRNLQCSKCQHKWFFTPKQAEETFRAEDIEDSLNAIKASIKAIKVQKFPESQVDSSIFYKLLCGGIMVIALVMGLIFAKPYLYNISTFKYFYKIISYEDISQLVIKNAAVNYEVKSDGNYLNINGIIHNQSNHSIESPHLRIRIYDENDKLIMQQILPYSRNEDIQADQIIPINYSMRLLVDYAKIHKVVFDAADNIDFLLGLR